MSIRRFPPPWRVDETDAAFVVRDAGGQALAYVFEDEPGRRAAAKLLTRDEARRFAVKYRRAAGVRTALIDRTTRRLVSKKASWVG